MTNIAVSQAVAPTHFFPPDPSSQIVCTIGGNVAENSGGAHCFKYGFTTNYVSGLEVVLPDGSEVHAGRAGARPPGLRPGGRVRGLGGHARDRHEDLAAGDPEAGGRAHARGLLRLDRPGRRGGVGDRGRGDRPGRDRDDGQPLDPRRRGRHERRLPDGRRRGARRGAGRLRGRVRGPLRAREGALRATPTACAWRRTRRSAS